MGKTTGFMDYTRKTSLDNIARPHVLVINDKKVVWTHSGYMPGNEVLVVDKALETIGKK